jgi:hypothetical protein
MPGSLGLLLPIADRIGAGLGTMYPGGVFQIVANTLANPTVVSTLAPHGLSTGDTVFFTNSTTSVPLLTATPQQVATVISPTTFSVPVNATTGGTAGAFDYAILSIPLTAAAVPATVNCGTAHGLRVGDTVTIVASGSTPSLDGVQTVTAVPTATSFVVGAVTNITVAGSLTTGHFTKTTFFSDVFDRGARSGDAAIVLTSVIGTAPVTTLVDIQGGVDLVNWYNIGYSTMAAPQTALYAQLTITTAVATVYRLLGQLQAGANPWRYLRLRFTSSTNIIVSALLHQGAS